MGKKIEVFQNGSLVDSFEELTDAREKVEEILAEGLKKEKKLSEIPFISLQEFDDEEDIEMHLHTDTYGELEEDLIEFLNDKGITDSDALKGMKEWLGVEVRLDMGIESKKEIFQKDISLLKYNEDLIESFLKISRPDLFDEILMDALKEHDPPIVKVVEELLGSDKLVVKIDVGKEEISEKTPSIEYLVGRIEKCGFTEPHSLKATIIENHQDKLEEMSSYVLSDDFPTGVTLLSDGIEWDITDVKIKNIQLFATDAIKYIKDREVTATGFLTGNFMDIMMNDTEFLSDYLMDMLMEDYDKYLIINIGVHTDPQDWAEKNREFEE